MQSVPKLTFHKGPGRVRISPCMVSHKTPGTPFPAADQARAPTARTPACIRCRTAAAAGPLPLPGTAAIED
eukprot:scaffold275815_cov24-Tisochrysis_lutea.AAC.2